VADSISDDAAQRSGSLLFRLVALATRHSSKGIVHLLMVLHRPRRHLPQKSPEPDLSSDTQEEVFPKKQMPTIDQWIQRMENQNWEERQAQTQLVRDIGRVVDETLDAH
jgi:hypothetical protein